ncbi:three component ABC system middle component [Maridesulfovibrio sp.]|uniref:three component ABC system middle component n=1 Tax=Maridesulfovibrio sp. TaxID=2795000 RepID=UPI0029CA67E7|nr:three component ABC system middle component [Maridesulfovibrio sp.]
MNKTLESIFTIHNSPFLLSELLYTFYENSCQRVLVPRQNDILLSYLVLPLVLPTDSRKSLIKSNKTSSLRSFIKKGHHLGINEAIHNWMSLTNKSLQFLLNSDFVFCIDSVVLVNESKEFNKSLASDDMLNAVAKLEYLFSPLDVPTIYRLLGVKKL